MADELILKAVELSATSAAFRKQYPTHAALLDAGWMMQRKYDGCFGMVRREHGKLCMHSRTGEDYSVSCKRILDALDPCLPDGHVLLGEVWVEGMEFKDISGEMRRKSKHSTRLCFVVNDMVPDGMDTDLAYRHRREAAKEALCYADAQVVKFAWNLDVDDDTVAEQVAADLVAMGGYDGVILRDPDAGYHCGKAKDGQIIKVKPCISLDLRVIGVVEGKGKQAGMAGALLVDMGAGVGCEVGTGMSDDERRAWWRLRTELHGQHIVEIEAMSVTQAGKLREPRYKGERFDKTEADR